jgi:transposase
MGMARYLVEAHLVEGRSVAELARTHGVHRSWIYKLIARYRAEGETAFDARSRRPRRSPTQVAERHVQEIVALREQLAAAALTRGLRRSTPTSRASTQTFPRSQRSGACSSGKASSHRSRTSARALR